MVPKLSISSLSIRKNGKSSPFLVPSTPSNVQTWYDPDGKIFSHCSCVEGGFRIDLPLGVSFFFDSKGKEVTVFPNASIGHEWVRDAYHRCVLPVVLQALGMEFLHASAIIVYGGVLAFCADSGTGKSTLAYALGQRDYKIWADDALGMTVSPPRAEIECHHLPFDIRLWKDSREAFASRLLNSPSLHQADTNDPADRESAPLRAIFLLRRDADMKDRKFALLKRLTIGEAFSELLSHAYCFSLQDMRRKKTMIENYLFISSRVPVFELEYRDGFDSLPRVLDTLEFCIQEIHSDANAH